MIKLITCTLITVLVFQDAAYAGYIASPSRVPQLTPEHKELVLPLAIAKVILKHSVRDMQDLWRKISVIQKDVPGDLEGDYKFAVFGGNIYVLRKNVMFRFVLNKKEDSLFKALLKYGIKMLETKMKIADRNTVVQVFRITPKMEQELNLLKDFMPGELEEIKAVKVEKISDALRQDRIPPNLHKRMVGFYEEVRARKLIGERLNDVEVGIRDIKAWVHFIKIFADELGIELAVIKGARYVFGDMIERKNQKWFEELIRIIFSDYFKKIPIKPAGEDLIQVSAGKVKIRDVTLTKNPNKGMYVPARETAELVISKDTPQMLYELEKAAEAVVLNDPLILVGETGVGKTAICRYLAYLTNNNFRRFNLNGQTDKTEFIGGYKPRADGSMKWVDGILVEAMQKGYWLLLDELNLAESSILERINSLLDDSRMLLISEHEGERYVPKHVYDEMVENGMDVSKVFPIHPNFRIFATMNPPGDYPGRQPLSPAFMNRFRIKWVDEPPEKELKEVLKKKYRIGGKILDKLYEFHVSVKKLNLGTRRFTLRNLLRTAERFSHYRNTGLGETALLVREIYEAYADGLSEKEELKALREVLKKVFETDVYYAEKIVFKKKKDKFFVGDAVLSICPDDYTRTEVPGVESELVLTPTAVKDLYKLAKCIEMKEKTLLVGPTGVGKTSYIRYLAHLTNNNFRRVNLDGQTDTGELLGEYVPTGIPGRYEWHDGILVEAMKEGDWILLDEFNLAEPEIMERINSLLDDDGYLVLTEHEGERIVPHHNFRLFAAMNPEKDAGRQRISPAMRNRLTEKWISGDMEFNEMADIVKHYLVSDSLIDDEEAIELAKEMIRFHKKIISEIEDKRIGGRRLGNETEVNYRFGLRDLKAWANNIKSLGIEGNRGLGLIKGAVYVYRDRLRVEGAEEAERFRSLLASMNYNKFAPPGSPVNLDDVIESPQRLRSRLERIVRGEMADDEAGDMLFILTQGYPEPLSRHIKTIAQQLGSYNPDEKVQGIASLRLFPGYVGNKIVAGIMKDFKWHAPAVKMALIELVAKYKVFQTEENLDIILNNFDGETEVIQKVIIESTRFMPADKSRDIIYDILKNKFSRLNSKSRMAVIKAVEGAKLIHKEEFQELLINILLDKSNDDKLRSYIFRIFIEGNIRVPGRWRKFRILDFFRIIFSIKPSQFSIDAPESWDAVQNIINIVVVIFSGIIGGIYHVEIIMPVFRWLFKSGIFVPMDIFSGCVAGLVCGGILGLVLNMILTQVVKYAVFYIKVILLYKNLPVSYDDFYNLFRMSTLPDTAFYQSGHSLDKLGSVPYAGIFREYYDRMVEITARNIADWQEENKTGRVTKSAYSEGKIEVTGEGKNLRILDTVIPIQTDREKISEDDIKALTLNRSTLDNLEKIAKAVALNDPLLLIGETGVGKTSLIRFLAHLTGNRFRRFNLNGQTDKMEFIGGYRPGPKGELEWFDGVLITAMKNGEWLLLDELNLAEPQILERMNSLLDDDGYIILREHKGEKIKPHKDFRLFASMNPSDYAGRKVLSPAFMNRFRIKWINEPSGDEILGILIDKYYLGKAKSGKLEDFVMAKIVLFHNAIKELARDRVLGADESEFYHFTLRNLLRLMDRIDNILLRLRVEGELPEDELMKIVTSQIRFVYGDMLRDPADRNAFEHLLSVYFGAGEEEEEYEIKYDDEGVIIGVIKIKRRPAELVNTDYVPDGSAELTHVPTTLSYLYKIAQAIDMKEHVLLAGPTGSSKTSLVRYLAYLTANNFVRVNLDTHTDTSELLGEYVPTQERGRYIWKDGILVEAMKNGYWLLLDEFNLAEPEIIERINSLLDDDGYIILSEHDGEKIKPHPNFRLFCAMNPADYSGRNRLSPALRNKFMEIWISGEFKDEELIDIVLGYFRNPAGKEKAAARMVGVHKKFKEKLEECGITKKRDEVADVTLRDLKSWAHFIEEFGNVIGEGSVFNLGANYVYRDRLVTTGLRQEFNEFLPKMTAGDKLDRIIELLGRNPNGGGFVPPEETARLIMTGSVKKDLFNLASSVLLKEAILLVGETGAGKTSLVRHLAHLTNNNLRRFNLNGQTDKFEFLGGYRPQPDGSINWEDGILITAMKNGDWIILDEINLAEPQVLERINSLLDDDGYIVLREHNGEKIKPDPNFRLFATMNPSDEALYPGRKKLSKAMMNRFKIKWIEEPSVSELEEILGEKYKGRLPEDIIQRIINIHIIFQNPSSKDDRRFTIRDLIKLCERVIYRKRITSDTVLEEAEEVYGTKSTFKPYNIEKTDGKVLLDDVELEIKTDRGGIVPGEDSELIPVETTLQYLKRIAKAVVMNEKPLLVGKTGTGKTALVRYLAHLTNTGFVRLNLDGQTDVSELIGQYVPGYEAGTYVWKDGVLVDAMKKGYWILLDEVNLAEPDILERINSLLDDDSKLIVTEHNGEIVRPHPDFRLFCAMNPPGGYSGRKNLSIAFRNKMTTIYMPDEMNKNELEFIVGSILGMDASLLEKDASSQEAAAPTRGTGEAAPARRTAAGPAARNIPAMPQGPQKGFKSQPPGRKGFSFAMPHFSRRRRYRTMVPEEEPKNLSLYGKWKLSKKKKELARIMGAIAKATGGDIKIRVVPGRRWEIFYDAKPVTITFPMEDFIEEDVKDIIGHILHEAGHRKISYTSAFAFGTETRQLLFNAVEDPRANNWQERTLRGAKGYISEIYEKRWPSEFPVDFEDEKVLPHEQFADLIIHHWLYGKLPSAVKNQRVIDAFNQVKDDIVEAYNTLPGSVVTVKNEDGKLMFHADAGDLEIEIPASGEVIKSIPNTEILVRVDPSGDISFKTPIGIKKIDALNKGEEKKVLVNVEPSERDIKLAGQRAAKIIKEKILPVYEGLVEESKKVVEGMMRGGRLKVVIVPYGAGRGVDGVIPEELISDEVNKYIEERAKKLAEELEGKIKGGDVREAKKEAESGRKKEEEERHRKGRAELSDGHDSMTDRGKPGGETHDKPARTGDEEQFRRLLEAERQKEEVRKEALKQKIEEGHIDSRYDDWRRPISHLISRLAGFLENILREDARPKYKGNYRTGKKPNLKRLMQLDRKIRENLPLTSEDYKVMLRKTRPVKRNHKFTIILDESGSMAGGVLEKNAISALIMFMEALGILNIDFCVIGFHSSYVFHKEFSERIDFRKREEIIREVNAAMGRGSTNDTLAVKVGLDDILKQDATDRTIIVITDGAGNGIGEMGPILNEADMAKVKVIGIGIGEGMDYVKETYRYARTCNTLEDVPEELANVLVEEVFTKTPEGRYALQMLLRERQEDVSVRADSHISVKKDGEEAFIDAGNIDKKGAVKGMSSLKRESKINIVHEGLAAFYGKNIFRYVRGIRIKRNMPQGNIAHLQDDYIDYDERLFTSLPAEYNNVWDRRESLNYLALLFEQAEHELLESILSRVKGIPPEIKEIVVILKNIRRFLDPNYGTAKKVFDKERYQKTILDILSRDEDNGIDPEERYRNLLVKAGDGKLKKKDIIIAIAGYIQETGWYKEMGEGLGDLSIRRNRRRIIRAVLKAEARLDNILGTEKAVSFLRSLFNWRGLAEKLSFNARYIPIGAVTLFFVLILRVCAVPSLSPRIIAITYPNYYNRSAEYHIQHILSRGDNAKVRECLIRALKDIKLSLRYARNENVRRYAMENLRRIGFDINKLVNYLIDYSDSDITIAAQEILLEIGPDAVPYILAAYRDKDFYDKRSLAEFLLRMCRERYGDRVKKLLQKRLGPDYRSKLKYDIYIADKDWDKFINMGRDGVKYLLRALTDWRSFVIKREIRAALLKIGPAGIEELVEGLYNKDGNIRTMSAEVLNEFKRKAGREIEKYLGKDYEDIIRAYLLIGRWKWEAVRDIGYPALFPLAQIIEDETTSADDRAQAKAVFEELKKKKYEEIVKKIKDGNLSREEIIGLINDYFLSTRLKTDGRLPAIMDVFKELIKAAGKADAYKEKAVKKRKRKKRGGRTPTRRMKKPGRSRRMRVLSPSGEIGRSA